MNRGVQAQRLKAIFDTYDSDHDGYITRQELVQCFEGIRRNVTPQTLNAYLQELGIFGNLIDSSSFIKLHDRVVEAERPASVPDRVVAIPRNQHRSMILQDVERIQLQGLARPRSLIVDGSGTILPGSMDQQSGSSQQASRSVLTRSMSQSSTTPLGGDAWVSTFPSSPEQQESTTTSMAGGSRPSIVLPASSIRHSAMLQDTSRPIVATSSEMVPSPGIPSVAIFSPGVPIPAAQAPTAVPLMNVEDMDDYYYYSDDDVSDETPFVKSSKLITLEEEESTPTAGQASSSVVDDTPQRSYRAMPAIGPDHPPSPHKPRREKTESRKYNRPQTTAASRQARRYQAENGQKEGVARTKRADGYIAMKDPSVRKQLAALPRSQPFFTFAVLMLQMIYCGFVIYKNNGPASVFTNPALGATDYMLINYGAMWPPCMRSTLDVSPYPDYACNPYYVGANMANNGSCAYYDNINDVCGSHGFFPNFSNPTVPDQWWRMFIAVFMTRGVLEMVIQIVLMYGLVRPVEISMGLWRTILLYLFSAICSGIVSGLMEPEKVTCTALGGTYGFIGLILVDMPQHWHLLWNPKWATIQVVCVGMFAILIGWLPFLNNWVHLGGLVSGVLLSLAILKPITFGDKDEKIKKLLRPVGAILFTAGLSIALWQFFTGRNAGSCTWCRWIDCVPGDSAWCGVYKGQ